MLQLSRYDGEEDSRMSKDLALGGSDTPSANERGIALSASPPPLSLFIDPASHVGSGVRLRNCW